MSAKHLLTSLLEGGFKLAVTDSGLKVAPSSLLTIEQRAAIKIHKPAIIGFLMAGQRAIENLPATLQKPLQVEPQPRSCPTCSQQLTSSGAYHFWCASGHYDLHEVIPADQRVNYCKFCHDALRNGACDACRIQGLSMIADTAKTSTATA